MVPLAILLGLRHATEPDHLTALATLVLDRDAGARRAGALGLAWGAGHAVTLFGLGLPFVMLGAALPDGARRGIEGAIGILIVALAVRLLVRWRHGAFHSHPHRHGDRLHAHPHAHDHAHHGGRCAPPHEHRHAGALGRTPLASFGIGLLHGAGGSAAAGALVAAASPGPAAAVASLACFAAAAALAMGAASWLFGLTAVRSARRVEALVPLAAAAGLVFGTTYALAALA